MKTKQMNIETLGKKNKKIIWRKKVGEKEQDDVKTISP